MFKKDTKLLKTKASKVTKDNKEFKELTKLLESVVASWKKK